MNYKKLKYRVILAILLFFLTIFAAIAVLKTANFNVLCATLSMASSDKATSETATCQIATYEGVFYTDNNIASTGFADTDKTNTNSYTFGPINDTFSSDYIEQLNSSYTNQNYQRYFSETSNSVSIDDCVLEAIEDAKADALKRYSSYSNVSITNCVKSPNIMGTYNYDQNNLNTYYYSVTGKTVDGTCSLVASTILAEYYYRKGYGGTLGDTNHRQIFWRMVNFGFSTGAYTYNSSNSSNPGGTTCSMLKKVITKYYDFYNVNLSGNYDTLFLKSTIESCNKKLKPVVGHFMSPNSERHGMTIIGYYDITVQYKKTSGAASYSTATMRYYVVNDGWHDDKSSVYRIQYINEEYLQSLTKIQ